MTNSWRCSNTVKLFNLGAVASCALLVGKKAGVTVLAHGGGQKIFLAQFGKKQILLILSTVHACMLPFQDKSSVLSFTLSLNTHFEHCFNKYSYVSFIRCYAYLSLWSIIIGFVDACLTQNFTLCLFSLS